ncbi:MAG: NAD(P)/FAD-dependent oxidoreductase [Anaerolineae bacterium]|nr:NAD(P)/FAD-dependent oxidoreductase [Anaerolineae bacterium]
MQDIEYVDVLIIGTGPSGSSLALHLIQKDRAWADRILMVDKAIHPRDKLCGGGITHMGQNILADLGLPFEPNNFPVNEVRLTYQDKSYSFYGNPVFRIVRRREFDHWLLQQVEARGATVRQGEAVEDVIHKQDYVEVRTEKAIIHAKIVVAADGSKSFVRRRLKWDDDSRVARLLEVDTPENPAETWEFENGVAVFDFTRMTDRLQGYYWDFPSYVDGKPIMNRGVFDSRVRPEKPKADLKQDLHDLLAERDRNLDDYKLKGHPIRTFNRNGKFAMPRVILIGDAAGVDPLMGEGISFALGYGIPASAAIADALERQDFSFDSYRDRLMAERLFKQLDIRVRLARFAYLMKYPRIVRAGWVAARFVVKLTPFKDPAYVPARLPTKMVVN